MDATSSYQAATKIDQTPLQSAQEIYVQAVSSGGELQSAAGLDTNFDSSDNAMAGSGGGGSTLPFQASKTGATTIIVNSGTVDGVAYSGGVSISISATRKVYLDVTVSAAGAVTAVTVGNDTSVPSDTSTKAYVLLADVTVTGGAISDVTNYLSGSLGHAYGGGTTHILWRV